MINLVSKSKSKFKPHIAVCHMSPSINGGSANEENIALVMKAKADGVKLNTILKALGEDAHVLEKATYKNLRDQLEASLHELIKTNNPTEEYVYVWIADFDESTVVFEHNDKTYSMSYTLSDNDVVELSGEFTEAVRHEIYTNVEGDALVLKGAEEVSDSLEATNEEVEVVKSTETLVLNDNKESSVTDQTEQTIDVEAIVQKALADQRKEIEAEIAQAELTKSTNAIVKGFSFIEEDSVEVIVKALTAVEGMEVIVKAFESAQVKLDEAEALVIKTKEEFGSKEQISDSEVPNIEKLSMAEQLKANMAKLKAAKA